jgi:hypothetical protein
MTPVQPCERRRAVAAMFYPSAVIFVAVAEVGR